MGRTKKKPGYDQNRIMEQFQNCIVEAYTSGMTDGSSMTYHEDVAAVKDSFKKMLEDGIYKADLFSDL